MCGIAGGIHFNTQPFSRKVLEMMTGVIGHRGPDDSGIHLDGALGMGFRRLSIIDLSPLGHQPMPADDENLWITFNGEIYNFELLRADLIHQGVSFKSKSDTEVILQLYLKHGTACFGFLRGMFAIAIWDKRNGQLVLARDRVGKKPLYYYADDDKVLFASELKSLYQYPGLDYSISTEALSEYFSFGFIGAPRTIYRSVSKLEPGHFLMVSADGRIKSRSYWNWVPPAKPAITSLNEAKEVVFNKVDECVRLRMRSDVPLGAFLSGGIDSTVVVARMAAHSSIPVKTFTIGFKEKSHDESDLAALVAKRYNTEHHVEIVDTDYAGLIERIVSNFDEPFGDSSALPTYVVSEMIRKHVTVALSGDGGDEVFGGYEIYQESLDNLKFDKIPQALKKAARLVDPVYPDTLPGRNYLRRLGLADPYERFIERYKLISDPERKKLLGERAFHDTIQFKKKYFEELEENTALLSALRFNDLKHYLEGDILVKVDRATMLNSIESRAPLLDHELIEMAFNIDNSLLIKDGKKKYILKETFKNEIPAELLEMPKKGFSLPLAKWFRKDLNNYFQSTVFTKEMEESGIINVDYVKHLFKIHASGKRDLSFHLWLILAFAIWYSNVYRMIGKKQVPTGKRDVASE